MSRPARCHSQAALTALLTLAATPALAVEPPSSAPTRASSTLDSVLARGELRVCTTGDYAPFSARTGDGNFEGIDIDMGRSLADSLGVDADFVPTTWPTLMADFLADRCDIAMSGISVNLERQRQAAFTQPYHIGGKTPIVRCEDAERYRTVAQIDSPSTRVIVNPGGTNERFTRTHFTHADVQVFDDNTRIFDEIADGRADVMVTDAIETELQANRHDNLCAVHPETPFTYVEKAYLLPRDDAAWQQYVDQWLHLTRQQGEYETIRQRWLHR
ncbi:transporter substrate-binding domain-containing protein [Salinicola avicenniae]|uniref:transporter substrate-binding domain-containing protein n=1 Tax=Salinicola avicenniae TaxID=2916836 RepID=UPI00207474F2|nr:MULTISPECIES: transporter substrate-binding domain-containing protein [unclassified Salinicola]